MQIGGEYPIVRLTERSMEVLEDGKPIMMKVIAQSSAGKGEKESVGTRKKGKTKISEDFSAKETEMFDALRALRIEIAKKEHVPPYVVFSDKSLKDMVVKKPHTKEAFLNVNGVGESKCKKYGKRFMETIGKY